MHYHEKPHEKGFFNVRKSSSPRWTWAGIWGLMLCPPDKCPGIKGRLMPLPWPGTYTKRILSGGQYELGTEEKGWRDAGGLGFGRKLGKWAAYVISLLRKPASLAFLSRGSVLPCPSLVKSSQEDLSNNKKYCYTRYGNLGVSIDNLWSLERWFLIMSLWW